MKIVALLVLFLSPLNSHSQLRVTIPSESELGSSELREGELLTSNDASTLFIHSSSVVAPVSNPAGAIIAFAGTVAPAGYLLCDGSAVSRATYANLFDVIGESFGQGDNSTTFNLPDFRGRFLRGVDGGAGRDPGGRTAMSLGGNPGDAVGSVQDDAFQGHYHQTHLASGGSGAQLSGTSSFNNGNGSATTQTQTKAPIADGTNGTPRTGLETRPKNANVNFIIKI